MKKNKADKGPDLFLENDFYHKEIEEIKKPCNLFPRFTMVFYRLARFKIYIAKKSVAKFLQLKNLFVGAASNLSALFFFLFFLFNAPVFLTVSFFFYSRLADTLNFIEFSESNDLKPNVSYMLYIFLSQKDEF